MRASIMGPAQTKGIGSNRRRRWLRNAGTLGLIGDPWELYVRYYGGYSARLQLGC